MWMNHTLMSGFLFGGSPFLVTSVDSYCFYISYSLCSRNLINLIIYAIPLAIPGYSVTHYHRGGAAESYKCSGHIYASESIVAFIY